MSTETAQWTQAMASLQDIFNFHEAQPLDSLMDSSDNKELSIFLTKLKNNDVNDIDSIQLKEQLQIIQDHLNNVTKSQELLNSINVTVSSLIKSISDEPTIEEPQGGKQYWESAFNPVGVIPLNSEVAYKPKKNNVDEEWFQCIVLKVSGDGIKYEVQDPEPDELGNAGKIFKCTWKEIIPIPSAKVRTSMKPYPMGTKVLARYPETTTFYPAVVSRDHKNNAKICKLRFDGEEEVNKETEVDRRFVLPFPTVSALPVNNAKRS